VRIAVDPHEPRRCAVTAVPSWIERLFGVRGYTERYAVQYGQTLIWDSSAERVDPRVLRAIEREYCGLWWSTAPPS